MVATELTFQSRPPVAQMGMNTKDAVSCSAAASGTWEFSLSTEIACTLPKSPRIYFSNKNIYLSRVDLGEGHKFKYICIKLEINTLGYVFEKSLVNRK